MRQQEFLIINRLGLHARASALFVKTASQFEAEIKLAREDVEVNGKSIMGLMMLAAGQGSKLKLTISGDDAPRAIREIEQLIDRKFDED